MEFRWESTHSACLNCTSRVSYIILAPTRRDSANLELRLIPNEVYLEILSYLYPSDSISEAESRRTFVNIASVCRFFAIHALPRLCNTLTLDARADSKKRLQTVITLYRKAQRGDALARYISQLARTCTIANWRGRGAFVDMTQMLRSVSTRLASVTTIKIANCTLTKHILDAVSMVPFLTTLHIAFCIWDHTVDAQSVAKLSEPTSTLCHLALIGLSDTMSLSLLSHITVTKVVDLDTDNEHAISHFAACQIPLRRLTIPRLDRPNAADRLANWLGAFPTLKEFTLTRLELPRPSIHGPPPTFPLQESALPALIKLTCPESIASQFGTNTRPHLIEAALIGETVTLMLQRARESPVNRKVRTPMMFANSLLTFHVDNLHSLAIPFFCLRPGNAPFNMPYPALENLIIQNYSRDRDSVAGGWILARTIQVRRSSCADSCGLRLINCRT